MKFSQKNFENWRFWKMHFFWVGHFEFFFFKKNFFFFFFCFILMKISPNLYGRMDGSNTYLMSSLFSSKFLAMRKITLYSVAVKCASCNVASNKIRRDSDFLENQVTLQLIFWTFESYLQKTKRWDGPDICWLIVKNEWKHAYIVQVAY